MGHVTVTVLVPGNCAIEQTVGALLERYTVGGDDPEWSKPDARLGWWLILASVPVRTLALPGVTIDDLVSGEVEANLDAQPLLDLRCATLLTEHGTALTDADALSSLREDPLVIYAHVDDRGWYELRRWQGGLPNVLPTAWWRAKLRDRLAEDPTALLVIVDGAV
jgi:hypothetical protein